LNLIKENLLTMIDMIQRSGAEVLLAGIQIPPNYGTRYTLPFFEQFIDIAKDRDLALVPFLIDRIPQQPELMQNDGLHPIAEAQFMILENVWLVLKPMLE
jgi:acyl-CoA thioesterase-1